MAFQPLLLLLLASAPSSVPIVSPSFLDVTAFKAAYGSPPALPILMKAVQPLPPELDVAGLMQEAKRIPLMRSAVGRRIVRNRGQGDVQGTGSPGGGYVFDRDHALARGGALQKAGDSLEQLFGGYLTPPGAPVRMQGFTLSPQAGRETTRYLISGGVGSGVPFHRHAEALLLLLSGEKEWTVARPGPTPTSTTVVHTFVQRGGEVLYLPEGWWHATRNTARDTVALGLQAPIPADPAMRAAQIAAQAGRSEGVRDVLLDVDDPFGIAAEALAAMSSGDEAVQHARQALRKDGGNTGALAVLCRNGDPPACEALPADSSELMTLKAVYLLSLPDPDVARAASLLSSAVQEPDATAEPFFRLGTVLYAVGDFPAAAAYLRSAQDRSPNDPAISAALELAQGALDAGEM